jgi:hypothetical protein
MWGESITALFRLLFGQVLRPLAHKDLGSSNEDDFSFGRRYPSHRGYVWGASTSPIEAARQDCGRGGEMEKPSSGMFP